MSRRHRSDPDGGIGIDNQGGAASLPSPADDELPADAPSGPASEMPLNIGELQDLPGVGALAPAVVPVPLTGTTHDIGASGSGWLVACGEVDLFARPTDSERTARRRFLARLGSGSLLPAVDGGDWELSLAPLPGATVLPMDGAELERLRAGVRASDAGQGEPDAALVPMATSLVRGVNLTITAISDATDHLKVPRDAAVIPVGQMSALEAGATLIGDGGVTWIRLIGGSALRVGDPHQRMDPAAGPYVIAGREWLEAEADCAVQSETSWDLFCRDALDQAVSGHFVELVGLLATRRQAERDTWAEQVHARKAARSEILTSVSESVRGAVVGQSVDSHESAPPHVPARAWRVMQILTSGRHIPLLAPGPGIAMPDEISAIQAIATASNLRTRWVRLEGKWWRDEMGILVGTAGGVAVPLTFHRKQYRQIDTRTLSASPITPRTAEAFGDHALIIYDPPPVDVGPAALGLQSLRAGRRDLVKLIAATALVAALGLASPVVLGSVLGALASKGSADGISQSIMLLLACAVIAAFVGVLQNILVVRLEGRTETRFQLAIWDRMLRLPTRFFSRFAIGALATAVLSISRVREALSGLTTQAVFGSVLVLVNGILLAVVAPGLALVALGVLVVSGLVFTVVGRRVVRLRKDLIPVEQRLATVTHQILAGLSRIKLAAAQERAFARWASHSQQAQVGTHRMRGAQAILTVVGALLPVLGQMVFFIMLAGPLREQVGQAGFFIALTSYVFILASMVQVGTAVVSALATVPMLQETAPLLEERLENREGGAQPPELTGAIEFAGVTFSYPGTETPVLDDVSFRVRPGQFVAIVGPSGSGKSTLLRLLLGFEEPDSGAVLYDDHELAGLDVAAVRRQLGVVLQNGQLFSGSIRDNICGSGSYSISQIWRAAEMAGVDSEISAMPMGMSTIVPFGGTTLSFGQRQRILIARALIAQPRILLFDEATSALDNRTQEIVTRSTEQLSATRMVIAHRLSTLVGADHIIVLDRGRIVQQGSFAALMADTDGLFHVLASRQQTTIPAGTGDQDEPDPADGAGQAPDNGSAGPAGSPGDSNRPKSDPGTG